MINKVLEIMKKNNNYIFYYNTSICNDYNYCKNFWYGERKKSEEKHKHSQFK